MDKQVINFLELNGFTKSITPDNNILLSNDMCTIHANNTQYIIINNTGYSYYSIDLNIYSLIGYLTYNGYIDKNFLLPDKFNKHENMDNIIYTKAKDIVMDELEPFIDYIITDEPQHIYLSDDLKMEDFELYMLSHHLDKYLTTNIPDTEIKLWDNVDDIIKSVMKYLK